MRINVYTNSGLYTDFTIKAFKHLGKKFNENYKLVVLDSDNLDGMVRQVRKANKVEKSFNETAVLDS